MSEFSTPDEKLPALFSAASKKFVDKPWVSVEFFPPKTEAGVETLFKVLAKLQVYGPVFADVTWGAGGSTSDLTMELCIRAKKMGAVPNMHLTCTNVDKEKIDAALETCKKEGITNILALRGDPPVGQEKWEASDLMFTCALDLVKYIRKEHGDYFNLTVAGYPEGHPTKMSVVEGGIDALSPAELKRYSVSVDADTGAKTIMVCRDDDYASEMAYLKEKIDAGASCIITQMFFDPEVFGQFVQDCRDIGITVPIIPGIMMLSNLGGFRRMTGFCKTRIPDNMENDIADIIAEHPEADAQNAAIKTYGIKYGVKMCQRLMELGTPGLHYYTLNQSATTMAIIDALGYAKDALMAAS
jgi:methylenetetrahydrofolate reductase (NADPH)